MWISVVPVLHQVTRASTEALLLPKLSLFLRPPPSRSPEARGWYIVSSCSIAFYQDDLWFPITWLRLDYYTGFYWSSCLFWGLSYKIVPDVSLPFIRQRSHPIYYRPRNMHYSACNKHDDSLSDDPTVFSLATAMIYNRYRTSCIPPLYNIYSPMPCVCEWKRHDLQLTFQVLSHLKPCDCPATVIARFGLSIISFQTNFHIHLVSSINNLSDTHLCVWTKHPKDIPLLYRHAPATGRSNSHR